MKGRRAIYKVLKATIAVMLLLLGAFDVHADEKELLIINSYNEAGPWSKDMILPVTLKMAQTKGIRSEIINLNSTLVHDSTEFKTMADGVFARYSTEHRPSYVVLIGNFAFSLMPRIKAQWGDVPVLLISKALTNGPEKYYYTLSPEQREHEKHTPLKDMQGEYNFTMIYVPDYFRETIDLMVRMMPNMKELVFVADEIFTNHDLNDSIRAYTSKKYPHLRYNWLPGNSHNGGKLRDYLVDESDTVGLLLSTWYYEHMNVHGRPVEIAGDFNLLPAAIHPVFALRDSYIGYGTVGGVYPNSEKTTEAIDMMLEAIIDKGMQPKDIPFYLPKEKQVVLNWPQVKEGVEIWHNLSNKDLPADIKWINPEKNFWEHYKWWIIGISLAVLAIIAILGFRNWYEHRRMTFMRSFHRLVSHMPIAFTEAKLHYDDDGTVDGIKYVNSNEAFKKLLETNSYNGHSLFSKDFLAEKAAQTLASSTPISFIHHFDKSDRYYEFIICELSKENPSDKHDLEIFASDITSRSKAEMKLKETARKLDLTLNAAHIIPWHWDLEQHKIYCEAFRVFKHLRFNAATSEPENAYVIDESEYFHYVNLEDYQRMMKMRDTLISGEETHQKMEFRMIYEKKGRKFVEWFEVNAAVGHTSPDGKVKTLIGSLLAITQRKRQEMALVAAKDKAKESDRLKSAFLANMSHEIRTPLNAIVGFSNLLAQMPDKGKRDQFVNIINDNNVLLLQLINDVLDLAKIESNTLDFNIQPTDVNAVMNSVAGTIRMRVPDRVMFNMVLGAEKCMTMTDSGRLSQVLINLLTNACKFTSKGSITMSYQIEDDELHFEVKDTGIGLTQDDMNRLFTRYTKLNNFKSGNGLGLSISKSLVEKMGGQIGVTSRGKGKGSTFWFTIPYTHAEDMVRTDLEAEKEDSRIEVHKERLTILIADDNDSNYLLLESILDKDFNLLRATNGKEAIDLYEKQHPDLILMDINMPVMDGYEAAHIIRKKDSQIPIIAVTAYALASERKQVLESHDFDSYVPKPINSKELRNAILKLLGSKYVLV